MKHNLANLPLLVFALLVTGGVISLYAYMYTEVGRSYSRALLARNVENAQKQDNIQAENVLALYQKTSADRDRLATFFISDGEAVSFIESLEGIGDAVGSKVELSGVTAQDTSAMKPGSYADISAHVDVTGSWQAVMKTLLLSERMPYETVIDSVTLSESAAASSQGKTENKKADTRIGHEWHVSYNIKGTILVKPQNNAAKN